MPTIDGEQYLTFAEAARRVPPKGVHEQTIRRWARKGVDHVKLESWRIGRTPVTTMAVLNRFFAGTTAASPLIQDGSSSPSHQQAEAALNAAGV